MLEVSQVALRLIYTGARPYAELTHNKLPHPIGFSRGEERDDVPDEFIKEIIIPLIENGGTAWKVTDTPTDTEGQAKAMLDVVQETPVEETPVEEPAVEEEPAAPVDDQTEAMQNALEEQFSERMTRAQMMSWCRSNGIATATTDTKASLTAKAQAFLNGDAGVDA